MDNFVAVTFASADDADKAYYDLKGNGYGPGYDVIQGALVMRDAEGLRISDHFESDWLDDDRYEDVVEKVVKARQDVCRALRWPCRSWTCSPRTRRPFWPWS